MTAWARHIQSLNLESEVVTVARRMEKQETEGPDELRLFTSTLYVPGSPPSLPMLLVAIGRLWTNLQASAGTAGRGLKISHETGSSS